MFEHSLTGNMYFLEDVPCALVPAVFVRAWKQWITRPTESPRPGDIDTSPFLCEHQHLMFDPNCRSDIGEVLCIIKRVEWEILATL